MDSKTISFMGITLTAYKAYEVTWLSRKGDYSSDLFPNKELFPTREEAETFADILRKAHSILGNTNDIKINVRERD